MTGGLSHVRRISALLPAVGRVATLADVVAVLDEVAAVTAATTGLPCLEIHLRLQPDRFHPVVVLGRPGTLAAPAAAALMGAEGPHGTLVAGGAAWVALTGADGAIVGMIGATDPDGHEPPAADTLAVLSSVAAYGSLAVRRAQSAAAATRRRTALEHLMRLSAELPADAGVADAAVAVADAARAALGEGSVGVALRAGEDAPDMFAWHGRSGPAFPAGRLTLACAEGLLRSGVDGGGCRLVGAAALARGNGRGSGAEDRMVLVGIRVGDGPLLGLLAASVPARIGWPDDDTRRALLLFAAKAGSAVVAAEADARAERLAGTDALTGLGTRRAFVRRAGEQVAAGEDGVLLLADLDGLKALNDRDGHAAGDALLRRTASVLEAASGSAAEVFRLGGDEFAILAPGTGAAAEGDGPARAASLRTRVTLALDHAGVSASVGVAMLAPDATLDALVDAADATMYEHKRDRRARSRRAAA